MRILFDQGAPVPVAAYLREHSVRTALEEGWDTLANGELLRVAEEAGFDVLLTADNHLAYQQNLKGRKIASWFLAETGGDWSSGWFGRSSPQSTAKSRGAIP
jgi:alkanesulfonate monooxygenase SsuD/methylene tetrahydromethanopterin reductase-like flavin-dependent oxidoreductase (luciferase family)